MTVLYCATVCSLRTLGNMSRKIGYPLTSITVQKFHRLILSGLQMNGVEIETASSIPYTGRLLNKEVDDEENGVKYHYLRTINIPVIRHCCIIIGTFLRVLRWHSRQKKQDVVICDALNISVCLGALLCRLRHVKVVGIMTDMPGLMVGGRVGMLGWIIRTINLFVLRQFDAYIFLTEAMNTKINKYDRPYIIMEGLVDINMQTAERHPDPVVRNIIYAGGIYEKYGVKMLIDAFRRINNPNLRLTIYGRGPMACDMAQYEKLDSRFHYVGVRPNDEIVEAELRAALLVNPRPSHEEFAKYSFPSKNMEYMVSGTPVLTTALPGMPQEYYDKLYICSEETVAGFASKIAEIMNYTDEELSSMGAKAKEFMLKYKNNRVQACRIIELVNNRIVSEIS